jgi:ligand-binding sensor domain-containing protein/signal transduction histidine kinase
MNEVKLLLVYLCRFKVCKGLFLLWLMVCTTNNASAQNIIPRFETIGVNDGLSQSSVYNIYQDKKGFMWFGTADGLNRYDGQFIKVFKVKGSAYNANCIRGQISEDSAGNIWYTNETGIFCYDVLTEQLTKKLALTEADQAAGIFIDEQDVFWMLCTDGVAGYNIGTKKWVQYSSYKLNQGYSNATGFRTATDKQHNIWFKDNGYGVHYFNTQTKQYRHYEMDKPVSCLYYKDGQLYYWYNNTLIIADAGVKTLSTIKGTAQSRSGVMIGILPDAYRRIWLVTSNAGLLCYDVLSGKFISYKHDTSRQKSLPFDITRSVYIDRFDNLWVGTDGGGVGRLDLKPAKFNLFPMNEGDYPTLTDYFIKCFYEDERGRIWFGTQNNGLNILDPADRSIKNYSGINTPGTLVSAIIKDASGAILVAGSMGIYAFNETRQSFKPVKLKGIPTQYFKKGSSFITKFRQLKNGEIIASAALGLIKIKKDVQGRYEANYAAGDQFQGMFTDVIEMPDKSLYATSPVFGLRHFKPGGSKYVDTDTQLQGMDLKALHIDEKDANRLWVSSGVGLISYNIGTKKITTYTETNGMANAYVYGVLQDKTGNLWISTNGGLSYFDRGKNAFQNYTANDGLQSNEFNTASYYKSKKGTLYFGGIKGFNWLDPETFYKGRHQPVVAITAILVDDKPYFENTRYLNTHSIELPYDKGSLAISFAALDYTMPTANKISYMLGNWDNKWVITAYKNVRYAKLSPGKYKFMVKAVNGDGVWSKMQYINVHIKAPFWQQAWFYLMAVMCALGIIIYFTWLLSQIKIKRRLRLLEKQHAIDAERNRIGRDMHDEIGSGLTHIALLSELIQTQHKTEMAIKADVGNISAAARKLVTNMSEIIWALNPHNDTLENLLAYTREQMQQYFEPFNMVLEVNFPDTVPDLPLTNEQRRNLYLVTKEALNNAMKHARASGINLSFETHNGNLQFAVTDNGCGLAEAGSRLNCNGLKNMRKRMEDIGGSIAWQNNKTGGLTVLYTIPS